MELASRSCSVSAASAGGGAPSGSSQPPFDGTGEQSDARLGHVPDAHGARVARVREVAHLGVDRAPPARRPRDRRCAGCRPRGSGGRRSLAVRSAQPSRRPPSGTAGRSASPRPGARPRTAPALTWRWDWRIGRRAGGGIALAMRLAVVVRAEVVHRCPLAPASRPAGRAIAPARVPGRNGRCPRETTLSSGRTCSSSRSREDERGCGLVGAEGEPTHARLGVLDGSPARGLGVVAVAPDRPLPWTSRSALTAAPRRRASPAAGPAAPAGGGSAPSTTRAWSWFGRHRTPALRRRLSGNASATRAA